MKVFVTGIGGQLGHDVMNELAKRRYESVGSDILTSVDSEYSYVQLDITDKDSVKLKKSHRIRKVIMLLRVCISTLLT